MTDLRRASPFIEPAAVEAWDAWFRWREHGHLHDVSIEDTWRRVAAALASVEPCEGALWQARITSALSSWRLLPDERLLADAGTGRSLPCDGSWHAALNVAAFVAAGRCVNAAVDLPALSDCAALAVRMLDDAALLTGAASPRLCIGILGLADALALLGLAYDSDAGRAHAAAMARAVAHGCLRGSVALAAERSPHGQQASAALSRAEARGAPAGLLNDAARHGLRHQQLTAITLHPRMALLANDVTDALDPLRSDDQVHVIAAADGPRTLRAPGYAKAILRTGGNEPDGLPDTMRNMPWMAQIMMRAAVQPWVDEPIDCPMLETGDLGDPQRLDANRLAAMHGLREPVWRSPVERSPL